MRQIKSLWTKPKGWNHAGATDLWRLSVHRLIEHHGEVWIFTDKQGESWLRSLGLPWGTFIHRELDCLTFDPHLWAIGKVFTYSIQDKPFIHTDADVIIGRPFPRRILNADFCAERIYHCLPGEWFARVRGYDAWKADYEAGNGISFNCGMFGGNDICAIRDYAKQAMAFARSNEPILKTVRPDLANMAVEEWSIARCIDPLEVSCYSAMGDGGNMLHKHEKSYWHLAGPSKHLPAEMAKVRKRLLSYC